MAKESKKSALKGMLKAGGKGGPGVPGLSIGGNPGGQLVTAGSGPSLSGAQAIGGGVSPNAHLGGVSSPAPIAQNPALMGGKITLPGDGTLQGATPGGLKNLTKVLDPISMLKNKLSMKKGKAPLAPTAPSALPQAAPSNDPTNKPVMVGGQPIYSSSPQPQMPQFDQNGNPTKAFMQQTVNGG